MENKIYIRKVNVRDILKVIRFYRELDSDIDARRYYRYMGYRGIKKLIRDYVKLALRMIFGDIFWVLFSRRILFFAAVDVSNKLLGICHIDIFREGNDLVGLYGIAISREYRGMGLGKLLSTFAITYVVNRYNVNKIRLSVDIDNINAIRLYLSLGFKVKKYIRQCDYRYTVGEWVDCYIMEKVAKDK